MSTRFRGLPPRVRIRNRDNRGGRLPTISRTVSTSDRTGAQQLKPFDDRRTLIFTTSSTEDISVPVRLRRDDIQEGIYADSEEYDLSQFEDIAFAGPGIVAGISDTAFEPQSSEAPYRPYAEVNQHEQGQASDFYLTGTDPVLVGPGFSSPLASKTQIKLTLHHVEKYEFLATTASIAHYDYSEQKFVRVGSTTNPQDAYCGRNTNDEPILFPSDPQSDAGMNYAHDARLFGPLGNCVVTGTVQTWTGFYNCPYEGLGGVVGEGGLPTLLASINQDAYTINPEFKFGDGQALQLPEVQDPFLLEKVVIELPLSASSGWLDDTTTFVYGSAFGQDIGGPCITVALISEFADSHREVICSGTIIPSGDDLLEIYEPEPPFVSFPAPHGFRAYGKPTVVVEGTNGLFRDRVRLEITPSVSNGIFATLLRPAGNPKTLSEAQFRTVNPFTRSMQNTLSGRSLFGKEFTLPDENSPPPVLNTDPTNRLDVFQFESWTPSPYIILPGDRITLAIAKHRSVTENPAPRDDGGDRTVMSQSHEVAIDSGTISVTMYGSLIQEGHEFQFGRNEPLTSLAASEALTFNNTVLDQYEAYPRVAYSGSYLDLYISGVITGSTGPGPTGLSTSNFRQVRGSSIGGTTSFPFNRFLRTRAPHEAYYDTLPPPPEDIQTTDGASIVQQDFLLSPTGETNIASFPLRIDTSLKSIDEGLTVESIEENSRWPFGFPFESRYGNITRLQAAVPKATADVEYVYGNGSSFDDTINSTQQKVLRADSITRAATGHISGSDVTILEHLQNSDPDNGVRGGRLDPGVFNKGFYGFGDFKRNQPKFSTPSATKTWSPNKRTFTHTWSTNAKIRGWKYGLLDGNQRTTSAVFRANRFGQFRDMLEQRKFARFVNLGNLGAATAGPIKVRFTLPDPADTESSNLSQFATSSVPYFEGEVRNRGPLPDNNIVQLDIPDFEP